MKKIKENKNNIIKTNLDMMFYLYRKIDINNYSKIKNKEEFVGRITPYINKEELFKKLKANKETIVEFSKKYLKEVLINIFNNKSYYEYMYNRIVNEKSNENNKIDNYKENEMKIEVSTIAGVKGETHTATLVCETFCYAYDIEHVIDDYIKKNKRNKRTIDMLHSLYVAFTRPTDMLCVAIRQEVYNNYKEEIDNLDVEIINI